MGDAKIFGINTYTLRNIGQWGNAYGRPSRMSSGDHIIKKNDRRLFADGAIIKATNLSEIYEKLENMKRNEK